MSILDFFPLPEIRTQQERALLFIEEKILAGHKDVILQAPTGCHVPDQRVIMYNGSLKRAAEMVKGDLLMGPDSKPRLVRRTIRGYGKLYRISPTKGKSFVVNEDHILALETTPCGYSSRSGEIPSSTGNFRKNLPTRFNISVKDYLGQSKTIKHISKLYHAPIIEFLPRDDGLPVPPHILGMWLGDGRTRSPELCGNDTDKVVLLQRFKQYGEQLGLTAKETYKDGKLRGMSIVRKKGSKRTNPFSDRLRSLGVFDRDHIPDLYLYGDVQTRRELLAGLIDTDGSGGPPGGVLSFSNSNKRLVDQVQFIAGSLGYLTWVYERYSGCQSGRFLSWSVHILGNDLDQIPLLNEHKRVPRKKINKDQTRTGFKVEPAGEGDYYGWELDQDQLYLLDDFLVTHNSGKSAIIIAATNWIKTQTQVPGIPGGYYLTSQKLLQRQLENDVPFLKPGLNNLRSIKSSVDYPCPHFKNCGFGARAKKKCSCMFSGECSYKLAKGFFMAATTAVTNYAYFFAERRYAGNLERRQLVACDECHAVEKQVISFVDLKISESQLQKFAPTLDDFPDIQSLEELLDWVTNVYIEEAKMRLVVLMELAEESGDDGFARDVFELDQHICKTNRALTDAKKDPTEWVFWSEKDSDGKTEHIARPLHAAPFMDEMVNAGGFVRIFTSAYPGEKDIFCRSLNLDPEETPIAKLGSDFPVENRKIIVFGVGPMSRRYQEETMPSLIKAVIKICGKHQDERGIIHGHSYEICEKINQALQGTDHALRVIFPRKAADREAAFETMVQTPDAILITPSMTEGFDFKDDLARWQIIPKIPYASLGNKQIAAKAAKDSDWYHCETVKAIIQTCGRIVRSNTDYGVTYILDDDFWRLYQSSSYMFPAWYRKAIVDARDQRTVR